MARLPAVGGDSNNWGSILNEYLSVEHNTDGTLKNAVKKGDLVFDVRDYGAVMGSSVSTGQKAVNLTAINSAKTAALAAGGGTILINGDLYVSDTVDFSNLGQTTIALVGTGALAQGSSIFFDGTDGTNYAFTLSGTSYFRISNLTINGRSKAKYGLFCARDVYPNTAGKHSFYDVRVVECKIASHLNYASEENLYLKCQFQRSPIGAIFTAFPVVSDPSVVGSTPCDFGATYQSSIAHHLYDCAIGSEYATTRCGLMIMGSMVKVFGGAIQAATGAEAYVIIDSTRRQCTFYNVDLDGNLANIGYKIGYFTQGLTPTYNWGNTIIISGGHMTINGTSGTSFISAYYLRHSIIEGISFNGPANTAIGFDLLDSLCRGNNFTNCVHDDNRDVTINDSSSDPSNIQITNGQIKFLAASGTTDPTISYASSAPSRLFLNAGIYTNPPSGTNVITQKRQGESATIFQITDTGILSWGDGTNATDTSLYRTSADVLRTNDQFRAGDGIATKTKAGAISDTDFTATPPDGTIALDTTNHRLCVRSGGTWRYTQLT